MGGRKARACVAALLVLTVGCGSRVAPQPVAVVGDTSSPAPANQAPSDHEPGGQAVESTPGSQPAPATPMEAPAPDAPDGGASPDYGPKHNNGAVTIELSATCVTPGDLLVVTLRTPPKAGLGMIIGYSDNQPHGAMLTGESDANGVYVWRVPVDPTVPEGEATVLVTATGANWEQEGGGTADAKFRVARGGC